ncbi:ribonuclease P protein component [Candidatus Woesebacteria bacterium GWA1_41_8]|uniref:Ribonuclease P protein component n=1 Tax=Candidatus Woesebacteria bacterium GWA1_41_8 TaxID=1802471 RepID=A0A1F7WKF4_9BACT|nr:MAG: ribonuclease P protein component [Candidatus Woesebacteria bacterium GWA1_41_8]
MYINKKDDLPSRYGFVVSTKIAKEAVHRNRIKRALREAVRHNLSILKNGHEVIFLTKRNIIRRTTDEIMKQVREALERVKKR